MEISKQALFTLIDALEREYLENVVAQGMLGSTGDPDWENKFRQVLEKAPGLDEVRQYFLRLRQSIETSSQADDALFEALLRLPSRKKPD